MEDIIKALGAALVANEMALSPANPYGWYIAGCVGGRIVVANEAYVYACCPVALAVGLSQPLNVGQMIGLFVYANS